jgi:hypothetical protein
MTCSNCGGATVVRRSGRAIPCGACGDGAGGGKLPPSALDLLRLCALNEVRPLEGDELHQARFLATTRFLELLPGCERSYGLTSKGDAVLAAGGRS